MKLDIGKTYIVYTTSEYITNKQVRILSYCSYEKATKYSSFIENVAINEKFINSTGDTAEYLKNQTYYECGTIVLENGEYKLTGETIILWDDIIDSEKTQRLYQDYIYKLSFKFKNIDNSDNITKESVIKFIKDTLETKYNSSKVKLDVELKEVVDNSLNSVMNQLDDAKAVISDANDTLISLNSMQESAKKIISGFEDNDINARITSVSDRLTSIESVIETIESRLQ